METMSKSVLQIFARLLAETGPEWDLTVDSGVWEARRSYRETGTAWLVVMREGRVTVTVTAGLLAFKHDGKGPEGLMAAIGALETAVEGAVEFVFGGEVDGPSREVSFLRDSVSKAAAVEEDIDFADAVVPLRVLCYAILDAHEGGDGECREFIRGQTEVLARVCLLMYSVGDMTLVDLVMAVGEILDMCIGHVVDGSDVSVQADVFVQGMVQLRVDNCWLPRVPVGNV